MKKLTIILILILFCPMLSIGQIFLPDVLSSSGDLNEEGGIFMQWHLGELAIVTLSNDGYDITQGFGQSDLIVTNISSPGNHHLEVSVYPNPVRKNLTIEFKQAEYSSFFQLFDMIGNMLDHSDIDHRISYIDMSDYQPGIYILRIIQPPSKIVEFKIIKTLHSDTR